MICVLSVLILLSCKKSATESDGSDSNSTVPVEITRVTMDLAGVSLGETVLLTCETEYPGGLNTHCDLALGSTSDDSGIIEKANASGIFNQGRWIRWSPAIPGESDSERIPRGLPRGKRANTRCLFSTDGGFDAKRHQAILSVCY
ncbi:hypothetical protein JW777_03765 [bacterium]|nr:hypothetical protein [bacterium]